MRKYATVSAKIPLELKQELKRLKIKPSQVIRRALEEEVKKRKVRTLLKELDEVKKFLTSPEETVRLIREIRDET
ncbi:MAG: hypothetical protein QXF45_04880 [Candidatus Caldarchaeum sp.]|uniref:CopG family transcriptional regulator n=1 Tax=Caldiarchaeum subterraneum TaxID=311458 RepID=A0A7C5U5W6_CALS0